MVSGICLHNYVGLSGLLVFGSVEVYWGGCWSLGAVGLLLGWVVSWVFWGGAVGLFLGLLFVVVLWCVVEEVFLCGVVGVVSGAKLSLKDVPGGGLCKWSVELVS
jgi:hypothetical protein